MKYLLQPTDNDVLHYAKGSESKSHNYISRVFKKGKWVYTYAKNRLRGNSVTNKTGKSQYAPNVKTKYINRADGHTIKTLNEPHWVLDSKMMDTGKKDSVTNQGSPDKQYNPNVKTVENEVTKYLVPEGNTIASTVDTHTIKAMTQVMDPTTKQSGLEAYYNIIQSRKKESVTNTSYAPGPDKPIDFQYTPEYNRNSSSTYSPNVKTLKYGDGKYRVTESTDWRKSATGSNSNKKHAIYAVNGGKEVKSKKK